VGLHDTLSPGKHPWTLFHKGAGGCSAVQRDGGEPYSQVDFQSSVAAVIRHGPISSGYDMHGGIN
jgi:hypothetical protein